MDGNTHQGTRLNYVEILVILAASRLLYGLSLDSLVPCRRTSTAILLQTNDFLFSISEKANTLNKYQKKGFLNQKCINGLFQNAILQVVGTHSGYGSLSVSDSQPAAVVVSCDAGRTRWHR